MLATGRTSASGPQAGPPPVPEYMDIAAEVRAAIEQGRPVVALESTVLAHGMPWPENLDVARGAERLIREAGAMPATVAVLAGRLAVGVSDATLERIARGRFVKTGVTDLGPLMAACGDGATTVSATVFAAARAGIALMATGGIGGVHRGAALDVSCDLTTLGSEAVAVVSAGAKAILDLPRTLEYLETLGVPVIGYGTDELPAFYTQRSGLTLEHRVDTPEQAAALIAAHFALERRRAVLIANPIPAKDELEQGLVERALDAALRAADDTRVTGKQLTPFLLAAVALETGRESVRANRALLLNNAKVAAQIAVALAQGPAWSLRHTWRTSGS